VARAMGAVILDLGASVCATVIVVNAALNSVVTISLNNFIDQNLSETCQLKLKT
jgi:hypothetical protein